MSPAKSARSAVKQAAPAAPASLWLWLSLGAVVLAVLGNVVALSVPAIYASLKPAFYAQAIAQDVADLAVVAPAWIIVTILALRGSPRAYLLWIGVLTFTVYNYVIYTVAVPFGSLFLLWVAVLGLALWALIGGVSSVDHEAERGTYRNPTVVKVTAWSLIVVGILFAFVWLSEDVPALLAGAAPASLAENGLITNPIHILDLSFFLPAALVTGLWLLRGRPLAFTIAPGMLTFLILTGIPILLTPVLQSMRGEAPAWGPEVPIGVLTLLMLVLLIWLLTTIRPGRAPGS